MYLYGSAGIDAFIGAIFYLVAANRVNKHGLLFAWAAVYGLIQGVMGYMFLIPYFLVVAVIAELTMIGKDTYRNAVRNRIGWTVNAIGNFVGCAVPLWWAWDSYQEMAVSSGFDANTLNMQFSTADEEQKRNRVQETRCTWLSSRSSRFMKDSTKLSFPKKIGIWHRKSARSILSSGKRSTIQTMHTSCPVS